MIIINLKKIHFRKDHRAIKANEEAISHFNKSLNALWKESIPESLNSSQNEVDVGESYIKGDIK